MVHPFFSKPDPENPPPPYTQESRTEDPILPRGHSSELSSSHEQSDTVDPELQPLLNSSSTLLTRKKNLSELIPSVRTCFKWSAVFLLSLACFSLVIGFPIAYFHYIPKKIEYMLNRESSTVFHGLHVHQWNAPGLYFSLDIQVPVDPPSPVDVVIAFYSGFSLSTPDTDKPVALLHEGKKISIPKNVAAVNTTLEFFLLDMDQGFWTELANKLVQDNGRAPSNLTFELNAYPDVLIPHFGSWKVPMKQTKRIQFGNTLFGTLNQRPSDHQAIAYVYVGNASFDVDALNISHKIQSLNPIKKTDQYEARVQVQGNNIHPVAMNDLGLNLTFQVQSEKGKPLVDVMIPIPALKAHSRFEAIVQAVTVLGSGKDLRNILEQISLDEIVPIYLTQFRVPFCDESHCGKEKNRLDANERHVNFLNGMLKKWKFKVDLDASLFDSDDVLSPLERARHLFPL